MTRQDIIAPTLHFSQVRLRHLAFLLLISGAWAQGGPKELVNSNLGVALTVPSGWADDAADSADNTLAFHFRPDGGEASLSLRVEEDSSRSLRGLWTALRYGVVVEQGGSILKDETIKIGQTPARVLTYEIYSDLGAEKHLEAYALVQHRLLVFSFEGPPAAFDAKVAQVRPILGSMRTLAPPKPEATSTPEPGEEEEPKP